MQTIERFIKAPMMSFLLNIEFKRNGSKDFVDYLKTAITLKMYLKNT